MEGEKRKAHKGGNNSRFDPSNLQEINYSIHVKKSFEDSGCLRFCGRVQEVGYHAQLTSIFSTIFRRDEANIVGIDFTLSTYDIASITGILNHGEVWFKGMELDIENYKMFLKPH